MEQLHHGADICRERRQTTIRTVQHPSGQVHRSSEEGKPDTNNQALLPHTKLVLTRSKNLNFVETNRDRQEAAILIFTVFTVIFLPSTFVTQFLAIVPLDFHDIGSMQWLFWAIAMPLTLTTAIIVLAWAGELKNVFSGVRNFVFKGRGLSKNERMRSRPPPAAPQGRWFRRPARHVPVMPPRVFSYPAHGPGMRRRATGMYDKEI